MPGLRGTPGWRQQQHHEDMNVALTVALNVATTQGLSALHSD
jgi:hypothetical protein